MKFRGRFTSAVLALALCLISAGPLPSVAAAEPARDLPIVALEHEVSGPAAVAALGPDLSKVASAHGQTAAELARNLMNDKSLHVDPKGRLLYKEEALPEDLAADAASGAEPWSAGLYPLAATFTLHSKPGSKRVVYLDFDGHLLANTAWNSGSVPNPLACPAWDTDGNPGAFGDAERTAIQRVWQRVAEDYAPFDVDVTTEAPAESAITRDGSTDEYYGTRVLISPISSYFGSYGGIAYVGAFDAIGDSYKPALVFPENLANGEKYIGEAAAHECGHNLGLSHDGKTDGTAYYSGQGTGETGWAPIMGNGYYKNLTQWSRGEYALANNTQDDLTIITQNGCPLRADDYPGTTAGAPRLPSGTALSASGIISTTGDADVISFSAGAGSVTLDTKPSLLGANLDLVLELRDEAGALVASANPVDAVGANLTATVPGGTYFVSVRGAGKGDPLATGYSDYGSLGAWVLTGTVANPVTDAAPVALMTPSGTAGTAPAAFTFDGSASYDPEGTALSWMWDFGDGTTASGAVATHTYASPGTYAVAMTVADAGGKSSMATTQITIVAPNSVPTARISATGSGAYAPVTATFDGAGSSDPDGSIVSWAWEFGDGTSGTGSSASHTYTNAGTYAVKLTVTDNSGATATTTYNFIVVPQAQPAMHIASVTVVVTSTKTGKSAKATVKVVDAQGQPVPGATVNGSWSGAATGSASAVTGSDGNASASKSYKKAGTVSFSVTQVAKSGWIYDAGSNTMTKAAPSLARRIRK